MATPCMRALTINFYTGYFAGEKCSQSYCIYMVCVCKYAQSRRGQGHALLPFETVSGGSYTVWCLVCSTNLHDKSYLWYGECLRGLSGTDYSHANFHGGEVISTKAS